VMTSRFSTARSMSQTSRSWLLSSSPCRNCTAQQRNVRQGCDMCIGARFLMLNAHPGVTCAAQHHSLCGASCGAQGSVTGVQRPGGTCLPRRMGSHLQPVDLATQLSQRGLAFAWVERLLRTSDNAVSFDCLASAMARQVGHVFTTINSRLLSGHGVELLQRGPL
jgi:hypothetical protein